MAEYSSAQILLVICGSMLVGAAINSVAFIEQDNVSDLIVYNEGDSFTFYNDSFHLSNSSRVSLLSGIYTTAGYFCVATKGRDPIDIAETTFHELAHYYIDSDKEHFGKHVEVP